MTTKIILFGRGEQEKTISLTARNGEVYQVHSSREGKPSQLPACNPNSPECMLKRTCLDAYDGRSEYLGGYCSGCGTTVDSSSRPGETAQES